MNAITLLFTAGILLLAFEVFVPGAILGIPRGQVALFVGVAIAFVAYGVGGGFAAAAIAVALIGLMLFIEFVVLPRTKSARRMFLETAIHREQPVGSERGGSRWPCRSGRSRRSCPPASSRWTAAATTPSAVPGPWPRGDSLRVVAVESFRIIVTKT
jgi:membrane-bound serine protease (ClpP class)